MSSTPRRAVLVLSLAAGLLASVPGAAEAQGADDEVPPRVVLEHPRSSNPDEARDLRTTGIATTVLGSLVSVIGVPVMMFGGGASDHGKGDGMFYGGAAMIAVGQAATLVGVPLWAVGGARVASAQRARLSVSASGLQGRF
jgi:hypothetical protein